MGSYLGGAFRGEKELLFVFSGILPAFLGGKLVSGIEGPSNPRGLTFVDRHQQNPKYPKFRAEGVCIASPPIGPIPVPLGLRKSGLEKHFICKLRKGMSDPLQNPPASDFGDRQVKQTHKG